jgi:hypothetical protein
MRFSAKRRLERGPSSRSWSATRGVLITDVFEGQGLAELTPKSARTTAVDFQHVDAR